jgi:hypothetical protein
MVRRTGHDNDRKTLSVGETIQKLRKAKTKKEKLEILSKGNNLGLQSILRLNFDPNIRPAIPEGAPPFAESKDPEGLAPTDLKREYKRFYYFLDVASSSHLKPEKKKKIFIGILERVDPIEAQILIDAKDKKLKCNLTKKIIDEAFPGLIKWETTDGNTEARA